MIGRRCFLSCLCCVFSFPVLAQEGKVIIVKSGSKELKRTAHHFQITVEQLKNARSTLEDATDLAHRLKTTPVSQLGDLAQEWTAINRPRAAAAIGRLVEEVRADALKADEFETYQKCAAAAKALLSSLAQVDFERALQLIRQWPKPPASSGEAGQGVLLLHIVQALYNK